MMRPERISYAFIVATLILVGWLHLATPFLVVLFAYFILSKLHFTKSKWLAIGLFLALTTGIAFGFVRFLNEAFESIPKIVSDSIPSIMQYAKENNVHLPFDDLDSLKSLALDSVKQQLRMLGNFARIATKEFVFLLVGFFVAISLFLNAKLELGREDHKVANNLYSVSGDFIAERFRTFYQSFSTVMGAQLTISAINTALTSVFVIWSNLPYAGLVIVATFCCGLLPIIGNLISNSIIVGIAFTISPRFGIAALIFLVVLHKLEYFLNSKIIGDRIKNPMWLTLLSLLLAERLMGIPGIILAPVILHYLKVETSQIAVVPKEDMPTLVKVESEDHDLSERLP